MKKLLASLSFATLVVTGVPNVANAQQFSDAQVKQIQGDLNHGYELYSQHKYLEAAALYRKYVENKTFPLGFRVEQEAALAVSLHAYVADISHDSNSPSLIEACNLMRHALANGADLAKAYKADGWWPDCFANGDRFYIDTDGVRRLSGTGGKPGAGSGSWVF